MFQTLSSFSFIYLKAPGTVSSAISLGLSLDPFPVWPVRNGASRKKLIHNIRSVRVKESHPSSCSCTETIPGFQKGGRRSTGERSLKSKRICVEHRVVLIFVWSGFVYSLADGVHICFLCDPTLWRLAVSLRLVFSWTSAFVVEF
jgi:hypothetical protein